MSFPRGSIHHRTSTVGFGLARPSEENGIHPPPGRPQDWAGFPERIPIPSNTGNRYCLATEITEVEDSKKEKDFSPSLKAYL
jgi:hypothetical protein